MGKEEGKEQRNEGRKGEKEEMGRGEGGRWGKRGREQKREDSAIQGCRTPTARTWWNQEPKLGLPDLRPIFILPGLFLK